MSSRSEYNMKYFALILVLCLVLFSQNALGEKLQPEEKLLEEKNLNLENEANNHENHIIQDLLLNNEECNCLDTQMCYFNKHGNAACKCDTGKIQKTNSEGKDTCIECNCHETQMCYVNKDGNAACKYDTGNIQITNSEGKDTYIECNCHDTQMCYVNEDGNAVCKCDTGKIQITNSEGKDTCIECNCHDTQMCYVNEDGNLACKCDTGKIQITNSEGKDTCIECNCHETQMCYVNKDGNAACKCDTGKIQITNSEGKDTCMECDCGPNGKCYLEKGEKICNCDRGFQQQDGKCDECDCGEYGVCNFRNGDKTCNCARFTAEQDGKCVECNCGAKALGCFFRSDGTKSCHCVDDFIYVDGKCTECNCGYHGMCKFELGQKKCVCSPNFIEIEGLCVANESSTTVTTEPSSLMTKILTSTVTYCNCGNYSKSCLYNLKGDKICDCFPGYVQKYGTCEECNCGPYGSCSFKYGQKKCHCRSSAVEMNGVCVDIGTSSGGTTNSIITSTAQECDCGPLGRCTIEYGEKKCICDSFTNERNGKCEKCHCGENSKSCAFNGMGEKGCVCDIGFTQIDGVCKEMCNCGLNALSCFFGERGVKICNCENGYIQKNGYCSAICNEDKCIHGKCEVIENDYNCRCNEGYTGQRCDEKVETKSNTWMILQFTISIAVFMLLSGMFCFLKKNIR